ncbi:MAG: Gfo/Idh/MocA family oxidoreductase [Planctomycetaceae bacterium]|jgi:predicted dehydrogenase|nr:Gfo/Idh/MocA family oxidoreductase [Planctomycetaceae bacterium]
MKKHLPSRRQFLKTAAAVSAAVAVPTLIPRSALAQGDTPGANDRIGIAGIGIGRQGSGVYLSAVKNKSAQAVCTCDVWQKRAEDIAKKAGIAEAAKNAFQDYRKVLDRNDVDAIVTATPEHWRSLICVNAALAGKHIYAEKPVTLTINDGKLMLKAARKSNIVFQCGSMQRSYRENYLGCKMVQEGKLGPIKEVIAANYESPWLCSLPEQPVPEGLDWNLWCGPTDPVPFHHDLFTPRANPGWLSFRPYSGGEMTGWGTHGFDQIQCALQMDSTGPVEIIVEGDKLNPPTYDKPESAARGNGICSNPKLSYRYANGITVTLGNANRGGGIFVGDKAKAEIFRSRVTSNPPELVKEYFDAHADIKLPSHVDNWIACIKTGERPVGDIESGHRSASICHLLNIARYLGRNLKWDPVKEEFPGDDEANTWLSRPHRKGFELPEV